MIALQGPRAAARADSVDELLSRATPPRDRTSALHRIALALCSTIDLDDVLDRLAFLTLDAIPADRCSVLLLGPDGRLVPGISTGSGSGADPHLFELMPPIDLVEHAGRWKAFEAARVIAIPEMAASPLIPQEFVRRFGSRSGLVAPLVAAGEAVGVLVLDWKTYRSDFDRDDIDTVRRIAELAAGAIRNATLLRDARLRADTLEHVAGVAEELTAAIAGSSHLKVAVTGLNRLLKPAAGCRIRSVVLVDSRLRELVGGRAPNTVEQSAIDAWRGSSLLPVRRGTHLLVPMRHGRRLLGCVRVTGLEEHLASSQEAIVLAAAIACAGFVHDARLRHEAVEQARRVAIQQERERIARDLHDSVGQVLVGLGMRLAAYAREAPDELWGTRLDDLAMLASEGNNQVRDAIESMLFLDVERQGIVAALRQLRATFEASTDIVTGLQIEGDTASIRRSDSEALFRVANEGLANVERHANATVVQVTLKVTDDEVSVSVRDDGVGLVHRQVFGSTEGHFGLRGLQMLVRDAGGELQLGDVRPHGALVEAVFKRHPGEAGKLSEACSRRHR